MSDFEISEFDMLHSLDGSVHSQGVRLNARAWLDIGSQEWAATTEQAKAAAWQAAQVTGWTQEAVSDIMLACFPHISPFIMLHTFEQLKEMQNKFPVEVEQVYDPLKEDSCPPSPSSE